MSGFETRYQISSFSMFDYKGIEDNLTAMAAKGWRIECIGAFLWKFKEQSRQTRSCCGFQGRVRNLNPCLQRVKSA